MLPFDQSYFTSSPNVVTWTTIPGLAEPDRGKTGDMYWPVAVGLGLLVRTDRLSAHDVVLPTAIVDKGKVLNQFTAYWSAKTTDIIDNQIVSTDIDEILEAIRKAGASDASAMKPMLEGRSMLVKKGVPLTSECIVRGYLFGTMWTEYKALCERAPKGAATVVWNGFELPIGMVQGQKLPKPIFCPSTKAADGKHDVNISYRKFCRLVGAEIAAQARLASLALYEQAEQEAAEKGILLCDSKFEFVIIDGKLILADEVLTPDSSRFWDAKLYKPGQDQVSFDKQFIRVWLDDLFKQGLWGKKYPGPEVPADTAAKTTERYVKAFQMITGHDLN